MTAGSRRREGTWVSLVLLTVVLAGFLMMLARVRDDWVGVGGWNGAWVANCARNHLTYGLGETKGVCVTNTEPAEPDEFRFYVHHPPAVPLLVAGSFAILGERAWAARSIPLLFSLASILLLYRLGSRLYGRDTALVGAALFATLPIVILTGPMVNHEAPTGFFVLLVVYLYARWRDAPSRPRLLGMLSAFAVGAQFGWPIYFLAMLLPLHALVADRSLGRAARLWWLPVTALLLLGGHFLQTRAAVGDVAAPALAAGFLYRSGVGEGPPDDTAASRWDKVTRSGGQPIGLEDAPREVTWSMWLRRTIRRGVALFGVPVLLLAAVWTGSLPKERARERGALVGALLAVGLLHMVVFRHGAYTHWYWPYYLSFGVAIAAAAGIGDLLAGDDFGPEAARQRTAYRRIGAFVAVLVAIGSLIGLRGLVTSGDSELSVRADRLPNMLGASTRWVLPAELGRVLLSLELPDGTVATNLSFSGPQLGYYSRRRIEYQHELPEPESFREWEHRGRIAAFAVAESGSEPDRWRRALSDFETVDERVLADTRLWIYGGRR